MAPTAEQIRSEMPQSAAELHQEERLNVLKTLTICLTLRERLVDRLLALEDKILETSAWDDALNSNIDESSELIATMCDILESEPNTDSNSDLMLTLMDDISTEEHSRDRYMKRKNCFATQIFRYNSDHTDGTVDEIEANKPHPDLKNVMNSSVHLYPCTKASTRSE